MEGTVVEFMIEDHVAENPGRASGLSVDRENGLRLPLWPVPPSLSHINISTPALPFRCTTNVGFPNALCMRYSLSAPLLAVPHQLTR